MTDRTLGRARPLTNEQVRKIAALSIDLFRELDQAKCEAIEAELQQLDPVEQQS